MARRGRTRDTPSIAVVGAGFGGLGMAVRLRRAGFGNLTLFERWDDSGPRGLVNAPPGSQPAGTWSAGRIPTIPPSALPPVGTRGYLPACAGRLGLLPHLRFGTGVRAAAFDHAAGRWSLTLDDGGTHQADLLVSAAGQVSRLSLAPAESDPAARRAGRRVAVVGTGVNAARFVPYLIPDVAQLSVFPDGAPHPVMTAGRARRPWLRTAHRVSGLLRLGGWPPQPPRADLPAGLRPPDPSGPPQAGAAGLPGQAWITLDAERRPPLDRHRITVLAERPAEIRPDGVVAADGTLRAADVVLVTTGFTAAEVLAPLAAGLPGEQPRPVRRARSDACSDACSGAYLGVSVAGLPNLFLLYGPYQRRVRPARPRPAGS